MSTFGEWLREKRKEKKIGLREFARRVGVSPTYVSKIERGEFNPPSALTAQTMAEVLGLDTMEAQVRAKHIPLEVEYLFWENPLYVSKMILTKGEEIIDAKGAQA